MRGHHYSNLDGNDSDQEDNLLFGMDTVDNSVFPLVPDAEFDAHGITNSGSLASIPEQSSFGDPLGVLRNDSATTTTTQPFRDDPDDDDEDLLV